MKINLEILDASFIMDKKEIKELKTKELVPKMVTRRRLTRASKIAIYLANEVNYTKERIVFGSSFGELLSTQTILSSIIDKEKISPTHFQNSVYNTAVSYLSILSENTHEIVTISTGDNTSENILKAGAVKALDGDEILLIGIETLNIPHITEINKCIDYLECGVALRVKISSGIANLTISSETKQKIPKSLMGLLSIASQCQNDTTNIIEVEL